MSVSIPDTSLSQRQLVQLKGPPHPSSADSQALIDLQRPSVLEAVVVALHVYLLDTFSSAHPQTCRVKHF